MDPLAADYASWSTYNYVLGNPVMFTDPDGRAPDTFYENETTGETVEVDDGIDKTIKVSDSDFEEAKFFANELDKDNINNADIVDAYLDFYNRNNSNDGLSFSAVYDYLAGGPERNLRKAEPIGSAGSLEFIGGVGARTIKSSGIAFKGLVQNRPLRELTHQELTKAFKGTGYKLSNHAITRLKDIRTQKLGFETLNDIKRIFNKGKQFTAKDGLKGVGLDGLQIIYNPKTNVIVTIRLGI